MGEKGFKKKISRRSFLEIIAGLGVTGLAGTAFRGLNGLPEAIAKTNRRGTKYYGYAGSVVPVAPDNPSIVHFDKFCKHGECGVCSTVCHEKQGVFGYWDPRVASEVVCVNCGQCTAYCPGKRGIPAMQERDETEKAFAFLENDEYHVVVQTAPAVRVAIGEEFGLPPGEWEEGQLVAALRRLGFDAVFDTNFAADLTIMEEATEFVKRVVYAEKPLPMFTSCCPGWVKFAEYFYPELLSHLSSCKSPQQMLGAVAKTYYAKERGIDPSKIISIAVMPCTAKKFEAQRPEMKAAAEYWHNEEITADVDLVLTVRELARMLKAKNIDLLALPEEDYDPILGEDTGAARIFGVTGGVMEAAVRTAYYFLTGEDPPDTLLEFTPVRGLDDVKEASLNINGATINIAVVNGLANVRNVCEIVMDNPNKWHFIEVMACRGGCISGGGQPRTEVPPTDEIRLARIESLYTSDELSQIRLSYLNEEVRALYEKFLGEPNGELAEELLHTHYVDRGPVA
ncbi:hydrogenase, Fe-only [Thermodesulfatator indicus DSM 15286]|uniref:Hydrogenase, Fe-only n=1 Tax=Thermodesulfatator indicus (strain DSM 15286 / JCM 11887 / CIR29812) TaxID=667014 RepID=F8A9K6_THEID|nr:[FeFe] hydrogenase, group A [Thermodesulfatator indicus]AEH45232.1 hydrogenase, Fe-only [Thermodesulfatator indicus DSM 15286]